MVGWREHELYDLLTLLQEITLQHYIDGTQARADFHLFKRRGRKPAPLSELRQGLGVWVKAFHPK
jgi:hypothetical protein